MFFIRGGVAAGTTCIVRVQVRGVRFDYFGQESSFPSLGEPTELFVKVYSVVSFILELCGP